MPDYHDDDNTQQFLINMTAEERLRPGRVACVFLHYQLSQFGSRTTLAPSVCVVTCAAGRMVQRMEAAAMDASQEKALESSRICKSGVIERRKKGIERAKVKGAA